MVKTTTKIFSTIFSRETSFFYFALWNDSDRMGWKDFLNYTIKNNLFYSPGCGERNSVWYNFDELKAMDSLFEKVLRTQSARIVPRITKQLDRYWPLLLPYLTYRKTLTTINEFLRFYHNLVCWWSAMTVIFAIPDNSNVDIKIRTLFLKYREESQEYTAEMDKIMQKFWDTYYPEHKDIGWVITPHEAGVIAKKGMSAARHKELLSRVAGFGMFNEKMYLKDELFKVLRKKKITLEDVKKKDIKEFGGNVAFKGKVIGNVCIIHTDQDFKKIKKGDILVTQMTTPDYVPCMKLSAAIVTDEGGLTCHAAIVAREMKKPCIIGTRVATRVLKDGDKVEVDADKGVVRKIDI